MGRTLRNVQTGRVLGVIFIEIHGNVLAKEINVVRFAQQGFAYIADSNHKYVYHPNNIFNGEYSDFPLYNKIDKFTYRSKSYLEIPSVLNNGWHVNGIVPVQELIADSLQIRSMTITIAIVSIFWALAVGFFISRKISLPLIHLCKLMKRSEHGDLSARSHIIGKNELGQLGLSFNKMNEKIQDLINRVAEKEAEKKKAEIRALRYQINPHFLYNTLNSIRWMAKLGKTHDVANAITNLVYLLEASIERKGLFVPLGEEIELLEKYMVIQQYRYSNQLTLQIDCPEHLKQIPIPRMLLQPIVENSIFHGIAPKEEPGNIDISIMEEGSNLVVFIRDNGIGIPREKLPELLKMRDNESGARGMTRIGLSHVDQTLKLYYGRDSGVTVYCTPGEGTTVKLVFGKQQKEEDFSYVQSVVS
jgi:two-component system sensor histidine kinase YesM